MRLRVTAATLQALEAREERAAQRAADDGGSAGG
jgi:hypothetical protein